METDRKDSGRKAKNFFEDLWKRGDPWSLETSAFEGSKYQRQIAMLGGRRYARVLEIGCGAGAFTRLLAGIADQVVAIDISPTAIARARAMAVGCPNLEFHVTNVMEYEPEVEGPWDLIVMSETVYYLGWLYSFFDVAWLATQLWSATRDGGQLLMANTFGGVEDYLLRPWVIRTYHDLFVNVGYRIESSETFLGRKDGVEIDVLITVFGKTSAEGTGP